MVPTPAAARYSAAGRPEAPDADAEDARLVQPPLPCFTHFGQKQVTAVTGIVHHWIIGRGLPEYSRAAEHAEHTESIEVGSGFA